MPGDSALIVDPLVDEVARALKQPDSPVSPQSLQ
jgi:hypothetical protein